MNRYRQAFEKPGERQQKELGRLFHIQREISYPLSILFVYLPLSPNQITVLANIVQFLGVLLVALGEGAQQLLGLCVYYVGDLLDFVDGNIARYRNQTSTTGVFLDQVGHVLMAPCFFVGLGYAASKAGSYDYLLVLLPVLAAFPALLSYQLVALRQFLPAEQIASVRSEEKESESRIKSILRKCISWPFHFKAELVLIALLLQQLPALALFFCCYFPTRFFLQFLLDFRMIREVDAKQRT